MIRSLLLILTFIISCSVHYTPEYKTVFDVNLAYKSDGSLVSLYVGLHDGHSVKYRKPITHKEFVYFCSGEWPSIYNKSRINMFELEGVTGMVLKDSIYLKEYPFCPSLDSLWKLRYNSYPFPGINERGWSRGKYTPSVEQQKYLYEQYGLLNIDVNKISDTSFWKLLRDVENISWINYYQNL